MKLKKLHTGIITQVRMTSTRLPGKVLLEVNGHSLLYYHIQRLLKTGYEIIIATTTNSSDDCICDFAEKNNIKYYRGSENNVLSRFYEAASKFNLDVIVRVTSDCPLIDPGLIRKGLEKFVQLNNPQLYLSNVLERTFARGFDFEIFSFEMLKQANTKASDATDLEHVTSYIWRNKSGQTEFFHVKQDKDNSRLRITVDTKEDFELVKVLIEQYKAAGLSYDEIENTLLKHPGLIEINAHVGQKEV